RAVGQLLLRHDVDAALNILHVQALVGVETLILRREVSGELGLRIPLQLQFDRVDLGAVAAARFARSRGCPAATIVIVTTRRGDERKCQNACREEPEPRPPHDGAPFPGADAPACAPAIEHTAPTPPRPGCPPVRAPGRPDRRSGRAGTHRPRTPKPQRCSTTRCCPRSDSRARSARLRNTRRRRPSCPTPSPRSAAP